MVSDCYIVGICGGTCSGKTTLAKHLSDDLGDSAIYLSQDSYYKDQSHKTADEITEHNFDHPDSVDLELLHDHLVQLKQANEIQQPTYCFKTHSRLADVKIIRPAKVAIVEGILIFCESELLNLFDMRVFVDVDTDVRLIRRIKRDCLERGRDIDSITEQYLTTVKPMHDQFVEGTKVKSDLIIDSDSFHEQSKSLKQLLAGKV